MPLFFSNSSHSRKGIHPQICCGWGCWGWSSKMTLEVLFYYHLCPSSSVACNSANTCTCASVHMRIHLCSSKLHLADAENQKENEVMCQGKEYVFLPVLGAYFCCLLWHKSQLSIPAGSWCHSMHRGGQGLFSKAQKRSCVLSWSKVVRIHSLKHFNEKQEVTPSLHSPKTGTIKTKVSSRNHDEEEYLLQQTAGSL